MQPPRVATYSVNITDMSGQQVGAVQTFPGSSSSLSLDISSLPQCMSYTVSVTASNTGGSATTNDTLCEFTTYSRSDQVHVHIPLSPRSPHLTGSVVCGWGGWLLPGGQLCAEPAWAGQWVQTRLHEQCWSCSRNFTQLSSRSRIAADLSDNQTIGYTGTAYDLMLRALGCPRREMIKCPIISILVEVAF